MEEFLKLEYPYRDKINLIDVVKEIQKFKPIIYLSIPRELDHNKLIPLGEKYFIIKDEYFKTDKINSLTDFFTEKQRVKCKVRKNQSPLDYWKKNKQEIIKKCFKKYNKINNNLLREVIYKSSKMCNNFKITVCLAVLGYFKPKRWLDISAGWGDRLITAVLSKYIEYYESTDPNLALQDGYNNIKNTFLLKDDRENYIIHPTGFLEASIKSTFDFVFSSPPFFDQEIYSNNENDSITKFNSNNSWVDNFMIPALRKCKDHLIKGGIMVIYIHNEPYLDNALLEFDRSMERIGSMYFYDHTKPRHMYVWKK